MISGVVLAAALWTAPVSAPDAASPWAAAPVPGWLESVAGGDLGRVRLVDSAGDEVPYRLVDPAARISERWRTATVINLARTATGFSCDLVAAGPFDELRLDLGGEAGVAEVRVTDGAGGVLADGIRVGRLRGLEVSVVPLPLTDAARLHLEATTLVPGLTLDGVSARGVEAPRAVPGGARLKLAVHELPGRNQAWRLALPGGAVRLRQLQLEVTAPAVFRRDARALAQAGSAPPVAVGAARIERIPLADGRPGLANLVIELRPGAYRRLELEVPSGGEAPLELSGATADAAPRWLVFPRDGSEPPLHLEAGRRSRSRSLETGALPVVLAEASRAAVGTRRTLPSKEVETEAPGWPWADALFVAAAALLALLGWRVFRSG